MDVRNATLEQLGYKVKEEEIITASAKAAGDEGVTKLQLGLPNVLNKYQSFPHTLCGSLCYLVSVAIQAPPAVKMQ